VSGLREFLAELRRSASGVQPGQDQDGGADAGYRRPAVGARAAAWVHMEFIGSFLLWTSALLTLFTGYAYLRTGLRHMTENP